MAKMKDKVTIIQDPEQPIEKTILAKAIVDISSGVRKLRESGLNEEAIIVLVKDKTGLYKNSISMVLTALADLKKDYCR